MSQLTSTIESVRTGINMSQRELAEKTGISQPTLNRIIRGDRSAKMPEILLIADALGCTVAELTGSAVADRVRCAARGTNGSNMEKMRQQLLHFMEIDAYLDDQAIPEQ
ncbi:hypothetical protein N24_2598 [Corynebacterium suranareeae]|uniref:HTH cro/C1-type domain-containing protein n=1 Tax=Corynebacterium suranareeae TaxID=2506452 RepID=A0A160PVQ8_9CORY|nr:helix-turn-helix transcriptional regulator [Corynebacterium suranareeae]BAU96860.1 hypothetical protein N24_2598 [Corynebacterium suranareeae]